MTEFPGEEKGAPHKRTASAELLECKEVGMLGSGGVGLWVPFGVGETTGSWVLSTSYIAALGIHSTGTLGALQVLSLWADSGLKKRVAGGRRLAPEVAGGGDKRGSG